MVKKITVKPNPRQQSRDDKVLEVSFCNSKGEYKGFSMSLRFFYDTPVVHVYWIDKGIKVNVDKKRE